MPLILTHASQIQANAATKKKEHAGLL